MSIDEVLLIIYLVWVGGVFGYLLGRHHEWQQNEKEKKETTFEFENKEP